MEAVLVQKVGDSSRVAATGAGACGLARDAGRRLWRVLAAPDVS